MYDPNTLLNTAICDVEFPDKETREYGVNFIAKNMYAQVDSEGCRYQLLQSIVDYEKNANAIATKDL